MFINNKYTHMQHPMYFRKYDLDNATITQMLDAQTKLTQQISQLEYDLQINYVEKLDQIKETTTMNQFLRAKEALVATTINQENVKLLCNYNDYLNSISRDILKNPIAKNFERQYNILKLSKCRLMIPKAQQQYQQVKQRYDQLKPIAFAEE